MDRTQWIADRLTSGDKLPLQVSFREPPTGQLELTFRKGAGRTEVVSQRFAGLLRASRPYYQVSKSVPELQIIHLGPGNLDGDRYEQFIHVEEGAEAIVGYQSAAKILPGPLGSLQRMNILLDQNSSLQLQPNVLIPFAESSFKNDTRIHLQRGARFMMADIVTGGWGADKQPFRFHKLSARIQVYLQGRLVLWDQMQLSEDTLPHAGGWSGKFSTVGTLYLFGKEDDDVESRLTSISSSVISQQTGDMEAGISKLIESGVVVRVLGKSVDQVRDYLKLCTDCFCEL